MVVGTGSMGQMASFCTVNSVSTLFQMITIGGSQEQERCSHIIGCLLYTPPIAAEMLRNRLGGRLWISAEVTGLLSWEISISLA